VGCFTTTCRMTLVDSKIDWVGHPLVLIGRYRLTLGFAGVFFFTLALFGFSCLSSLGLFANERILFMRERCDLRTLTVIAPLLTHTANKIKRILFLFHLLHVQGMPISSYSMTLRGRCPSRSYLTSFRCALCRRCSSVASCMDWSASFRQ
jgi:hypothetical protein